MYKNETEKCYNIALKQQLLPFFNTNVITHKEIIYILTLLHEKI